MVWGLGFRVEGGGSMVDCLVFGGFVLDLGEVGAEFVEEDLVALDQALVVVRLRTRAT